MTPDILFLLWHNRPTGDGLSDSKLLGVFTDRDSGWSEVARFIEMEGFKDFPEGFLIESVPADQTVFDTQAFGLDDLVRLSLEASFTDVSLWAPPLVEVIESGSLGVFAIVEAIHEQTRSMAEAEEVTRAVTRQWVPNRVKTPEHVIPERRVDFKDVAQCFWSFRRAGFPTEPPWDSPSHKTWKSQFISYRIVLLWEQLGGIDDILEMIVALAEGASAFGEYDYIARGTLWNAVNLAPGGRHLLLALKARTFVGRSALLAAFEGP